jgi:hypothetical protein
MGCNNSKEEVPENKETESKETRTENMKIKTEDKTDLRMTRVTIIKFKIDIYDLLSKNIIEYGYFFKKMLLSKNNDFFESACKKNTYIENIHEFFGEFLPTEFEVGINEYTILSRGVGFSSNKQCMQHPYTNPYYKDKEWYKWYNFFGWINDPRTYRITYITKVERVIDIINHFKKINDQEKINNSMNAIFSSSPISEKLEINDKIDCEKIKKIFMNKKEYEYDNRIISPPTIFRGYNKHRERCSYEIFKIVDGKENEFIENTCIFLENPIKTEHSVFYEKYVIKMGTHMERVSLDKDYIFDPTYGYIFPKLDIGESCHVLSPEVFNYLYNNNYQ